MKLRMIDPVTGMYLRDAEVGEMSEAEARGFDPAYIFDPIPEGLLVARWDGKQWVGGLPPEPPSEETVVVTQPAQEERLAALEAAMLDMILGGASQ